MTVSIVAQLFRNARVVAVLQLVAAVDLHGLDREAVRHEGDRVICRDLRVGRAYRYIALDGRGIPLPRAGVAGLFRARAGVAGLFRARAGLRGGGDVAVGVIGVGLHRLLPQGEVIEPGRAGIVVERAVDNDPPNRFAALLRHDGPHGTLPVGGGPMAVLGRKDCP